MSADQQPEFEVGARVTFHPYEKALPAKVVEVLPNHFGDERMVYHLDGLDVKSYTTGKCIEESRFYEPHIECVVKDELGKHCPNPADKTRAHNGVDVRLCEQCARNFDAGHYINGLINPA